MKLDKFQRAVLINQFETLARLDNSSGGYKKIIDALERGYELDIDAQLFEFYGDLSEQQCHFVRDIMWLYYLMKLAKNSTKDLSREDMSKLDPKFPGFDGNAGDGLLGYADYITQTLGEYPEHKHYLNSHGAHPNYDAMLGLWRKWGKPTTLTSAQADELLELKARA